MLCLPYSYSVLVVLLDSAFSRTPCFHVLPKGLLTLTPVQPKPAFVSNAIGENVMFLSLIEMIFETTNEEAQKGDKEVQEADGDTAVVGRLWWAGCGGQT